MPSYTMSSSAPRPPGSQRPPHRLEGPSLCFSVSVVWTGWFSAFLSSCTGELGSAPFAALSCNTSFKVTYLAKLLISFAISFPPALIAGDRSCFCKEAGSDSSRPPRSHTHTAEQSPGDDPVPHCPLLTSPLLPVAVTICRHGKDGLIVGLNHATEVIRCGKIAQSKNNNN